MYEILGKELVLQLPHRGYHILHIASGQARKHVQHFGALAIVQMDGDKASQIVAGEFRIEGDQIHVAELEAGNAERVRTAHKLNGQKVLEVVPCLLVHALADLLELPHPGGKVGAEMRSQRTSSDGAKGEDAVALENEGVP